MVPAVNHHLVEGCHRQKVVIAPADSRKLNVEKHCQIERYGDNQHKTDGPHLVRAADESNEHPDYGQIT